MENHDGNEGEIRRAGRSHHEPESEPEGPSETDKLIDVWWTDHFPGSVVGRFELAWNHTFAAVQDLKRRLRRSS